MLDALKLVNTELLGFSYHPSEIERFSRFVREETDRIMEFGAFARAMDNRKLQAMLKQCSAKEIYDFCSAYTYVYSLPHFGAFLCQDKDALEELSGLVKELETYGGYDRIQQNIIRTFIRALDSISFS